MIKVVERAQNQDASADPNQTVQSFIDLCQRHEHNFYKFVHEVHIHDNGLFTSLMGWLEGILDFLRKGPKGGKLDMNALFQGAVDMHQIDKEKAIKEVNDLVSWQEARKKWHHNKTRQKMAAEGAGVESAPGIKSFKSSDFGLNEVSFSFAPSFNSYLTISSRRTSKSSTLKMKRKAATKTSWPTTSIPFPRSDVAALGNKIIFDAVPASLSSLKYKKCTSCPRASTLCYAWCWQTKSAKHFGASIILNLFDLSDMELESSGIGRAINLQGGR